MDPIINAIGLGKRYGGGLRPRYIEALSDFSLSVQPGEAFGLLGPNGAGKTTFIKILLGVVKPTSGTAHLLGRPVGDPLARARVGYLPEQHRFPGHLTARQALDLYARLGGMAAHARKSERARLLGLVGLADWVDVSVKKFSKGMMQRLGLAQALLGNPELVILDEPSDGVDPVGRREIRELVSWLKSTGTTVFLNSHLLSEVEMVCGRVAILNKGSLLREGSIGELTTAPAAYSVLGSSASGPLPDSVKGHTESDWIRYEVPATSEAELTSLLRSMIDAGVLIREVLPAKRSLEEAFLDLVSEPEVPHA